MKSKKLTDSEELIGKAEAAMFLGISPKTISGWILKKILPFPAYRVGGHFRFKVSDLEKYLEGHRENHGANLEGGDGHG